MKLDGLLIREEPIREILAGKKTWEIRGGRTHKRGKIALIQSKSGTVVGTAKLVDCIGPLSVAEFNRNLRKSRSEKLRSMDDIDYAKIYAWVLKDVRKFRKPVKYKHKSGIIIWHPVEI